MLLPHRRHEHSKTTILLPLWYTCSLLPLLNQFVHLAMSICLFETNKDWELLVKLACRGCFLSFRLANVSPVEVDGVEPFNFLIRHWSVLFVLLFVEVQSLDWQWLWVNTMQIYWKRVQPMKLQWQRQTHTRARQDQPFCDTWQSSVHSQTETALDSPSWICQTYRVQRRIEWVHWSYCPICSLLHSKWIQSKGEVNQDVLNVRRAHAQLWHMHHLIRHVPYSKHQSDAP